MRVIISATKTKPTIAIRVAKTIPKNEGKDIIFSFSVLSCAVILRAAKKIMLSAKMTARSLKTKTINISNLHLIIFKYVDEPSCSLRYRVTMINSTPRSIRAYPDPG